MADLKTLAEQSLWKAEAGVKALPDAIREGAALIGASDDDVRKLLKRTERVERQLALLHKSLEAVAKGCDADIPVNRASGGSKEP